MYFFCIFRLLNRSQVRKLSRANSLTTYDGIHLELNTITCMIVVFKGQAMQSFNAPYQFHMIATSALQVNLHKLPLKQIM